MRVELPHSPAHYTLERLKRRTIAIQIGPTGEVLVKAPRFASERLIRDFVREKSDWITKKQDLVRRSAELYPERKFEEGEEFFFLGRRVRLSFDERPAMEPALSGGLLRMRPRSPEALRSKLAAWYRHKAERLFAHRARRYSGLLGLAPSRICVKEQRSRWGSCARSGVLRFNWKIVMAPLKVVDYVVVHELCHLRHMDHSRRFWSLVGSILTDYPASKAWLRDHARALRF